MKRLIRVISVLAIAIAPVLVSAQTVETPRHGLMWQTTGLPAVFPLQIKTRAGRNYYVRLFDVQTDEPALAAFINGGTFFRVLVPPGRFTVKVAAGFTWLGEEKLFGSGVSTQIIDLPEPLDFSVHGFSKKTGHLIDLTKVVSGEIAQKEQSICKTYGLDPRLLNHRKSNDPYVRLYGFVAQLNHEHWENGTSRPHWLYPKRRLRARLC